MALKIDFSHIRIGSSGAKIAPHYIKIALSRAKVAPLGYIKTIIITLENKIKLHGENYLQRCVQNIGNLVKIKAKLKVL
jgi:hypothetical protein